MPSNALNSIPAMPKSATLKFLKITAPVRSIIAPFLPVFQEVKSSKMAGTRGFS